MKNRLDFLPTTEEDVRARNWSQVDFVYVTGDAYVDHPSFGVAIISRVLEAAGFRVAILAQPDYKSTEDFKRFGRPRLGFLVTGGNIDSMVAHYTVSKKRRSYDYYSPGGKMGLRPDRATIVYCNRIREAYGDIPIIIGGLEASLRRFAHYDYWDDKIRRSILVDSRADLLTYGMGENILRRLAFLLDKGVPIKKIRDVRGCVYVGKIGDTVHFDSVEVGDYDVLKNDKSAYAKAFSVQYKNTDSVNGKAVIDEGKCTKCGVCVGKCPFGAAPKQADSACRIFVGGTWGKTQRMGTLLSTLYTCDEIHTVIEKVMLWYKENGYVKERLGATIDRLGADVLESALATNDLLDRKDEILAKPLLERK